MRRQHIRRPVTRGQLSLDTAPQRSDMEGKKEHNKKRRPAKDAPELRVVEIHSKPGPDGEERLRRLFTLLVKLASDDEALSLRK